jgi:hypothetical protein
MWWFRKKQEEEAEETRRLVKHAAALHGVPTDEVVHAILDEDDEDLDDEEELRGRSRLGIWAMVIVVGGVFGLGIVFLFRFANGGAESGPIAVEGIEAIKKSIQPTAAALPTLTGHFVSFSYPQVFDSVKTMSNLPTTAERFSIGSKSNYRRSIMVTVENKTATYDEDSGYKYRSMNPSLYHSESVKLSGGTGVVMIKNDNTERTLYWARGGKLVMVSVTSTNAGDALQSYIAVIAGSIRWVG